MRARATTVGTPSPAREPRTMTRSGRDRAVAPRNLASNGGMVNDPDWSVVST